MYQQSALDFNDAGQQQSGEVIPKNTIAKVVANIRPGNVGPGGWLTQSNSSDVQYLSFEFIVIEGPFAKRRFWQNMTVTGGKLDEHGQSKGWGITKATLRAMLDSAYGIDPDDDSPLARQKRVTQDFGAFNGLNIVAKIGVEVGKDNNPDRNKLSLVLTRKNPEYAQIMFGAQPGYVPQPASVMPTQGFAVPGGVAPQQAPAATGAAPVNTTQGGAVPTWAR